MDPRETILKLQKARKHLQDAFKDNQDSDSESAGSSIDLQAMAERIQHLRTSQHSAVLGGFAMKMIENGYPDSSNASSPQAENSRNALYSLEELITRPPVGVQLVACWKTRFVNSRQLTCMPVSFQIAHKLLDITHN